jgi:hypothetical protein
MSQHPQTLALLDLVNRYFVRHGNSDTFRIVARLLKAHANKMYMAGMIEGYYTFYWCPTRKSGGWHTDGSRIIIEGKKELVTYVDVPMTDEQRASILYKKSILDLVKNQLGHPCRGIEDINNALDMDNMSCSPAIFNSKEDTFARWMSM